MESIFNILPKNAKIGVGLAITYDNRYLFFLAGERHKCPPNEIFYAGIGGHLEEGESLLNCAHREAMEEIGVDIEVLSSTDNVNFKLYPLQLIQHLIQHY